MRRFGATAADMPLGPGLARRIFTSQAWSVQPCVRPLDAVHMTAGHHALRGSGSGQNPAFDNAVARAGCPDRRIDPALHYVLFALPTFTSRRNVGAISLRRQCDGFLGALTFGHHRPRHPGELVGERNGGDPRWPPRRTHVQQTAPYAIPFGASTILGSRIVKVEPYPGLLATVMSPPII
jgi:hypothetical protein